MLQVTVSGLFFNMFVYLGHRALLVHAGISLAAAS